MCEDSKVSIDRENVVALKKSVISGFLETVPVPYLDVVFLMTALVPSACSAILSKTPFTKLSIMLRALLEIPKVDLLQHLVDVNSKALLSSSAFLVPGSLGLGL